MKMGEFLLNEKTRVSLNIVNFLLLFGFIVTVVFTWATWSTDIDNRINNNKMSLVTEKESRIESDLNINKKLDEMIPLIQQNQKDYAVIQKDLEWIKSMQSQIWEKVNETN